VTVGAPFNPYKIFQGVLAPYWILEHKGIGSGAKLCYNRLLGFAGKDARFCPSLERLGTSLGVSERQARDYVKELERAGLVVIEQRGLRKTNLYLFLCTKELEQLINRVLGRPNDPDEPDGTPQQGGPSEGKQCSGPIGINSEE
jgi:biotin operon repressor